MRQGNRQVVTVSGKGVVLLGNNALAHFAKTRWSDAHFGMKHPRKVGFFVVPKLKPNFGNRFG